MQLHPAQIAAWRQARNADLLCRKRLIQGHPADPCREGILRREDGSRYKKPIDLTYRNESIFDLYSLLFCFPLIHKKFPIGADAHGIGTRAD